MNLTGEVTHYSSIGMHDRHNRALCDAQYVQNVLQPLSTLNV